MTLLRTCLDKTEINEFVLFDFFFFTFVLEVFNMVAIFKQILGITKREHECLFSVPDIFFQLFEIFFYILMFKNHN